MLTRKKSKKERRRKIVKKLSCLVLTLLLVMAMAVPGWSVDMTGKWGISLSGGAWKLGLTDHSDFWTLGPFASFGVKYGLDKSVTVGATGYWMQTYIADLTDSSMIKDGAGLTITNLDGGYRQRNFLFEATAEYHFLPDNEKFSPYVLGGAGIYFWAWKNKDWETLTSDSFSAYPYNQMGIPDTALDGTAYELKDQEITAVAGAGFEWFPIPQLAINFGGKFHLLTHLLTSFKDDKDIVGTGAGELDLPMSIAEAFGGITYYVGAKKDSDKDGVTDDLDQCPDTPLGAVVDANGCPLDSDGDGVYDGLDQCPDTPKGAKVDMNGCPMDSDGDGVYDGIDQCPSTPSEARGKTDAKGCPLDTDGDGVPDYKDNCPNTAKSCQVDAAGCPVDSDGDNVCDGVDKCPNTPLGRSVDAFGCPISEFIPEPEKPVVLKGVNFEFNKSSLLDVSKTVLDQVAESLKDRPDVKVEIAGHCDSKGSDAYNLKLSDRRAAAVREYLISKGVPASQLTSRGYGESQPIASNDTDEGRAQNRRVELRRM
jgi:outer membrane protein OmpA-like peptidoglycan-associated protein